jgi:hypothetical protein
MTEPFVEECRETRAGVTHRVRTYASGTRVTVITMADGVEPRPTRQRLRLYGTPVHRMTEDEITEADRNEASQEGMK